MADAATDDAPASPSKTKKKVIKKKVVRRVVKKKDGTIISSTVEPAPLEGATENEKPGAPPRRKSSGAVGLRSAASLLQKEGNDDPPEQAPAKKPLQNGKAAEAPASPTRRSATRSTTDKKVRSKSLGQKASNKSASSKSKTLESPPVSPNGKLRSKTPSSKTSSKSSSSSKTSAESPPASPKGKAVRSKSSSSSSSSPAYVPSSPTTPKGKAVRSKSSSSSASSPAYVPSSPTTPKTPTTSSSSSSSKSTRAAAKAAATRATTSKSQRAATGAAAKAAAAKASSSTSQTSSLAPKTKPTKSPRPAAAAPVSPPKSPQRRASPPRPAEQQQPSTPTKSSPRPATAAPAAAAAAMAPPQSPVKQRIAALSAARNPTVPVPMTPGSPTKKFAPNAASALPRPALAAPPLLSDEKEKPPPPPKTAAAAEKLSSAAEPAVQKEKPAPAPAPPTPTNTAAPVKKPAAAPAPSAAAAAPTAAKAKAAPPPAKPATPAAAAAPAPAPKTAAKRTAKSAMTSNNVYIYSEQYAWMPARLLEWKTEPTGAANKPQNPTAVVQIPDYGKEEEIGVEGAAVTEWKQATVTVTTKQYGPKATTLPLQNVDKGGRLTLKEDMVDLAFLHEAAILYNLKARHVQCLPYTRVGDIVIAVNPYQWLEELYTAQQQTTYARQLVWDTTEDPSDARRHVAPHVYESSSLAYRGVALTGIAQSILVSGESGAGKTETVKICMNHIALVQQGGSNKSGPGGAGGKGGGDHRAAPTGLNKVVQRVVQSNPLLEVFGNAKTRRNDNSSRFGKYVQLQFDRDEVAAAALEEEERKRKEEEAGPLQQQQEQQTIQKPKKKWKVYSGRGGSSDDTNNSSNNAGNSAANADRDAEKMGAIDAEKEPKKLAPLPSCQLAGSKCEVYLLEKARVVGHDSAERTFHIFYAILAASDADKKQIWKGLLGKGNADFNYVGHTDWQQWDGTPDSEHYAMTRDNLALIGVTGDKLMALMRAITIVLQCGQIAFSSDEHDKEKCVVENKHEFEGLSELTGIPASDLQQAFTQKTMATRGEVFTVPLKPDGAKDSCDAFAKEIYSKAFLWLVREINAATCAEDNYDGDKKEGFRTVGLLDIFGFESFPVNGFEQLCINYANEKLQAKFTKDIFMTVEEEYRKEGVALDDIRYDDNSDVLDLIESRNGLLALLEQECVRPKGTAREFVYKVRSEQRKSSCLIADKFENKILSPVEFGVCHYAGKVIYYTEGFLQRNQDTIAPDLYKIAEESSNDIISKHLKNEAMMNGRAADATKAVKREKSGTITDTLWNKFKGQLSSLMKNLGETQSRYIRCIKPNTLKQPQVMQHMPTVEQLRCAGVVAAVTITRSAFPSRLDHKACFDRFQVVHRPEKPFKKRRKDYDIREELEKILAQALAEFEKEEHDKEAYVVGKTRVYFRSGVLEYMENKRMECWDIWANDIQRTARGYFVRRETRKLRLAKFHELFKDKGHYAIPIQTRWRVVMAKKDIQQIRYDRLHNFASRLGGRTSSPAQKKPQRKVGKLKMNPLWS